VAVKLEDIAKKAKVSVSTVSLALNDKIGVSSKKRKEIKEIAEEMGYPIVVNDKNKKVRFIIYKRHGNVVSDTPFFSKLIEGVQIQSRLNNYDLSISHIRYDEENLKGIIDGINDESDKGILLLATEMLQEDIGYFKNIKKPIVLLDSHFKNKNYDYILINNVSAAYKATLHLINSGHQNIGYLHSSVYINNFRDRKRGFVEALQDNNIKYTEEYEYKIKPTLEGAYADMKGILESNKAELPTAFFADNDIIAFGSMRAMKEHGIRIPEDISIIGFDDMPFCEISNPRLSTIKVFKEEMGKLAVNRLIDKIESLKSPNQKIELDTEIVIRDSVLQN